MLRNNNTRRHNIQPLHEPCVTLVALLLHFETQEAAIGSTMVHPNIVAVYSITLRPSSAPAPPGLNIQPGSGSSGDVLLLDQGRSSGAGGAAAAGTGAAAGASVTPHVVAGTAELLPWEMQLVMEYCDQVSL
jgi:hypothetical protein